MEELSRASRYNALPGFVDFINYLFLEYHTAVEEERKARTATTREKLPAVYKINDAITELLSAIKIKEDNSELPPVSLDNYKEAFGAGLTLKTPEQSLKMAKFELKEQLSRAVDKYFKACSEGYRKQMKNGGADNGSRKD